MCKRNEYNGNVLLRERIDVPTTHMEKSYVKKLK